MTISQRVCVVLCSSLFAAVSAYAVELDLQMSFSGSEQAVFEGLAEYQYTDGSTDSLYAGSGFGILLGKTLKEFGPVSIIAKGGFQYGAISANSGGISYHDSFSYFPVLLTGSYAINEKISLGGGLSYLIAPKYKFSIDDYKFEAKGLSDFGYHVELITVLSDVKFYVRYTDNTVAYQSFSDTNNNSGNIEDTIKDEDVSAWNLGLSLSF